MTDQEHKQKLAVRSWISPEQAKAYAAYASIPMKPRLREYLWIFLTLLLGWMWLSQNEHISSLVILEREHQILVKECAELNERATQHAAVISTLLDRGGQLQIDGKTVAVCYRRGRT